MVRNCSLLLLVYLLLNPPLWATALSPEATTYLEGASRLIASSHERLALFNEETARLLNELDRRAERADLPKREVYLKENQELKKSIWQTHKAFIEFRHLASDSVAQEFHGSPYAALVYARSFYSLTDWYLASLAKSLSPLFGTLLEQPSLFV